MAVESWPRPNNEAAPEHRQGGPINVVYIGSSGQDARPDGPNNHRPPEPKREDAELEDEPAPSTRNV